MTSMSGGPVECDGTARSSRAVAVAARLFDAITRGDVAAVLECYADDAVLWSNTSGATMSPPEIAGLVKLVAESIPDFRYDERSCQATDSGFVEQHVIRGTSPAGDAFAIDACCVASVRDGRITRVDEYADAAALMRMGL
jgi:ketosteroid isomerase-like protein